MFQSTPTGGNGPEGSKKAAFSSRQPSPPFWLGRGWVRVGVSQGPQSLTIRLMVLWFMGEGGRGGGFGMTTPLRLGGGGVWRSPPPTTTTTLFNLAIEPLG